MQARLKGWIYYSLSVIDNFSRKVIIVVRLTSVERKWCSWYSFENSSNIWLNIQVNKFTNCTLLQNETNDSLHGACHRRTHSNNFPPPLHSNTSFESFQILPTDLDLRVLFFANNQKALHCRLIPQGLYRSATLLECHCHLEPALFLNLRFH